MSTTHRQSGDLGVGHLEVRDSEREEALTALETRLGVAFRDRHVLRRALRHRSLTLDAPLTSNERLEFLGDSIVGIVICDYLFHRFPDLSEGELAKRKAYIASEPVLAAAALRFGLDSAVELSPSEDVAGGRMRRSILSDAFEAVVAAIYLDRGLRVARGFVRRALRPAMLRVRDEEYHEDYKSQLQERTQAKMRKTPTYRIASESGEAHDKTFVAHVLIGKKVLGQGEGKSKKAAEQAAAFAALRGQAV